MSRFVCIENTGVAPVEAWTMLGVSSARGKKDKIGQFGSGAKHGITTCLRHGINPTVLAGRTEIVFDCVKKMMGDTQYDQVIAYVDGDRKELSFATQFGEIDWTSLEMAMREFYSNAFDQGGFRVFMADNMEAADDKTRVYIESTPEIVNAVNAMDNVFLQLHGKENVTIIAKNELTPIKLYRKGVLVYTGKPNQLSLFDYNGENIKLDESRNLASYAIDSYVASIACQNEDCMQSIMSAIIDNKECIEVRISPYYYSKNALKKAFEKLHGNRKICMKDTLQYVRNNTNAVALPNAWFDYLKDTLPIAELNGSRKGLENGYTPSKISKTHLSMARKVWRKIEKTGMSRNKPIPPIEGFATTMSYGSLTLGYYEDGIVYLNVNNFSISTIIEEFAHYITGSDDCTRDFQDFAFELASRLI